LGLLGLMLITLGFAGQVLATALHDTLAVVLAIGAVLRLAWLRADGTAGPTAPGERRPPAARPADAVAAVRPPAAGPSPACGHHPAQRGLPAHRGRALSLRPRRRPLALVRDGDDPAGQPHHRIGLAAGGHGLAPGLDARGAVHDRGRPAGDQVVVDRRGRPAD